MAISRERLLSLRPFLFHLTASSNLNRIVETGRIESAGNLAASARREDLLRERRRSHERIQIDGAEVELRDQCPLHAGNMTLEPGQTLGDFVALLNARVFFWPGTGTGPIPYGMRHYQRYAAEKPSILRVGTAVLLDENPSRQPLLCRYNSGSPRCSNGAKSPRTSHTFVAEEEADFTAGEIVEITFIDYVKLPPSFELGDHPCGPWRPVTMR